MSPMSTEPSKRRRKGPGFLEAIVALSILVSLSGVLMPAVGEQVMKSRVDQADKDMIDIARGLAHYSRDTLFLPTGVQGRTNVAWMYGPGEIPAGQQFGTGGEARPLADALSNDTMGGPAWAGPYIAGLTADPWGHAYLVNVDGWVNAREHAIVVSAGPDGRVQTPPTATAAVGDDLLYVMD
jgi:type II secretory pathway pseudopilin PulG